ncbi:glucose 1-dehydrogenase [Mycobacterium sp. M23085]|uniref:glucose 1-dehydrogenase n=1 Tax=Mycobacterium sp. M23085 TaxID=3378087 RepID=UPI003877E17E
MGRADNKVVLISGGGGGIGGESARLLAKEGARVAIADVRLEDAKAVADQNGNNAIALNLDVTSEEQWEAAVLRIEDAFGPINALVNSAGIASYGPTEHVPQQEFRRLLDVNLLGTFLGFKAALPSMRRAGGGSVVNVSSLAGMVGMAGAAGYTASKWAVRGFTKAVAAEFGHEGIRVNSVHPGVIDTPLAAAQKAIIDQLMPNLPLGRIGNPIEVAQLVLHLVSDESSYSTGTEFTVDGGWSAT